MTADAAVSRVNRSFSRVGNFRAGFQKVPGQDIAYLIGGNWKNGAVGKPADTKSFVTAWVDDFRDQTLLNSGIDIVVIPPATAIHALATHADNILSTDGTGALVMLPRILGLRGGLVPALTRGHTVEGITRFGVGGQDFYHTLGAYTGAVSPQGLRDAGADFALVGHSERRHVFGESDNVVAKKLGVGLDASLHIILCIGEKREEREERETEKILDRHLTSALGPSSPFSVLRTQRPEVDDQLDIAYEPVWAIGTGLTATPAEAEAAHAFVRAWVWDHLGEELARKIRIIYGGSVKPDNVSRLMAQPNIDGALVGGASLDPVSFAAIANFDQS